MNCRDFWICWRSKTPCLRNSCRSCALRWMILLLRCHQCNPLPREKALSQFLMWHGQTLEPWRMFGRSWLWQYWYVLTLLPKISCTPPCAENKTRFVFNIYLRYSGILQYLYLKQSSFYNSLQNLFQVWCLYLTFYFLYSCFQCVCIA